MIKHSFCPFILHAFKFIRKSKQSSIKVEPAMIILVMAQQNNLILKTTIMNFNKPQPCVRVKANLVQVF